MLTSPHQQVVAMTLAGSKECNGQKFYFTECWTGSYWRVQAQQSSGDGNDHVTESGAAVLS